MGTFLLLFLVFCSFLIGCCHFVFLMEFSTEMIPATNVHLLVRVIVVQQLSMILRAIFRTITPPSRSVVVDMHSPVNFVFQ